MKVVLFIDYIVRGVFLLEMYFFNVKIKVFVDKLFNCFKYIVCIVDR